MARTVPQSKTAETKQEDKLAGLFFHSFTVKDGEPRVKWQGMVQAHIRDGFYLVEIYDWLTGENRYGKIVSLATMQDWDFYFSNEHMTSVYKNEWSHNR